MSTIEDVYEVKTTSSLGGLKAAADALRSHAGEIKGVAKAAAGAAGGGVKAMVSGVKSLAGMSLGGLQRTMEGVGKAINGIKTGAIDAAKKGLSGLGQVGGGVLKVLGGIPQQFFFVTQMLGTLSQSVAGFLTAAAASSPELKASLDKLGAAFGAVKNEVLGAFAKAVMPALEALGKAMSDPRFQAFVTMLSDYLGKAVGWLADQFANKLLPAFLALLPKIKPIVDAMVAFFSAVKGGQDPLLALTNAVYAIGKALGASPKDLAKLSEGMTKVRQAVALAKDFIAKAMGVVQEAIKTAADWWKKHSQEIKAAFMAMWSALKPIFEVLFQELARIWKEIGPQILKAVKDITGEAYQTIIPIVLAIANFIKDHSDDIMAVVRAATRIIGDVIKIFLDVVQTNIRVVLAIIRGDWSGAWNLVKDFTSNLVANIRDILSNFLSGVLALVGTNTQAFVDTWRTNWQMFVTIMQAVIGNVVSSINTFFGSIGSSITSYLNGIVSTWRTNWNSLIDIVSAVWDDVTGSVKTAIENVKGFLSALGDDLKTPWNGLAAFVKGVWNGVVAAVVSGANWVINAINALIDAYNSVIVVIGGTPIPHIPNIGMPGSEGQQGAQSVVAGASTSSAPRSNPSMAGASAPSVVGSVQASTASIIINIYGPFGPGYTPEQAGTAAANSFVTTARAQGVRV